ncbi:MAG TPA: alanine--tRNA ligase, partial [Pseudomonadota bacterium]|nr:alanine--tRNA ligase [Pseudomonadota bacterium]
MQVAAIRQQFLDYFAARGHTIVPSAPLVPGNDPTLLFTNSGMVQFKEVFLGTDRRSYVRAADVQRCLRAGGKHNDLENIGYTARHHTFFEMLGNWSFGDYFKREAIAYAWQLLTEVYGLPAEKLWITVYQTDDEAYQAWTGDIGVPRERVVRIGDNKGAPYASDNFWQMADTGPCGPCSEIFYDHGPSVAGGPPGSADEGDRYVEIWNLVFMQFDRDQHGVLSPLPKPCVDTGMGLERLAAVLQGVHSNYDIDLFRDLIAAAAKLTGATDLGSPSLKVIADHIRACAFLVVDGVIPSNEGRGYVLRRIIRRAIRHGYKLGQTRPFFAGLVPELARLMGEAYPELPLKQDEVMAVLHAEEERFAETLEHGMKILDAALAEAKAMDSHTLSGVTAFTLYDTYGFPLDLTADICRERGVDVDQEGFDAAMGKQRQQARAASTFRMAEGLEYRGAKTVFDGYDRLSEEARVVALYRDGSAVDTLASGQEGIVVLDRTPFYAESGGQVGDRGELSKSGACLTLFAVHDTQKVQAEVFGHHGEVKTGALALGDIVTARVDGHARARAAWNHSATHLMH